MAGWISKSSCFRIRNPFIRVFKSYCQSVTVAYSEFKPSEILNKPVVVLHGLLGSKINWKSLAKTISSNCNRTVYTLDARNHGDSPHSDNFNYPVMAADVRAFVKKQNLESFALVGHSMGGRTAMFLALSEPKMVEKLIVVDVSPCDMPGDSSVISKYMESMKEVLKTLPFGSSLPKARSLASDLMARSVPELGLRMFLLSNLTSDGSRFKWKANIDVLTEQFDSSIRNFSPPPGIYPGDTLFICGEKSQYVSPDDHQSIKHIFPEAKFVYIPGAGHWVHSEKPKEFMMEVEKFL